MAKYGTFKYGEMPYGDALLWIYSRTYADMENNTEYAYINYWDLNRIETRMFELSNQMNQYGYTQTLSVKTDWTVQAAAWDLTNIPTLEHLIRLHANTKKLMDAFFVYPNTPQLPESFENLTVFTMNDIEKILHDLHYMLKDMAVYFRECDTFYCGEE